MTERSQEEVEAWRSGFAAASELIHVAAAITKDATLRQLARTVEGSRDSMEERFARGY